MRGAGATYPAMRVFFPAAALLAALGPWLLLLAMPGQEQPLISVATHARSMLIGYVGALIAGYLGGKLTAAQIALLLGLWLAGRCAELLTEQFLLTYALYAGYGLTLAALVVPRFRAAKKWRNRLIAPLLTAITCFPLLLWAQDALELSSLFPLHTLLMLVSLLLFFMGGRFITPLLARAYAERGLKLPHRVQPVLEGLVILLLLSAVLLGLLQFSAAYCAIPTGLAGLVILLRLWRWQLFLLLPPQPVILVMGFGYLWLGFGLLLFSLAQAGLLPLNASLHIIGIGALGTLSATVMLKFSHGTDNAPAVVHYLTIILIACAMVLRFAAPALPVHYHKLLIAAAACWSLCFLLVAYTVGTYRKTSA